MLKSLFLWTIAILLTLGSAIYQRTSGPTYPIEGSVAFGDQEISYRFLTSHTTTKDQLVQLVVRDTSITGRLYFRKVPSFEDYQNKRLIRKDTLLYAHLPKQPAAGKLEYRIELKKTNKKQLLPEKGPVTTRFKDDVPAVALLPHILFMFSAMLFSTRSGLEALRRNAANLYRYTLVTVVLMALGGLIFGPLVQKYAFGQYWTGFPFGTDLTDNKTMVAFLVWILALFKIRKNPRAKGWVLAAAIVTFIIFIIPHSMMGSEIDYTKADSLETASSRLQRLL